MKKHTFTFAAVAAGWALAASAQINIGFGGPDGVRVSLGPTPPPPPPPPAPAAVVVQPAPVVVAPAPAPVVVAQPAPVAVVPEYGYGWYGEYWVPTYQGWYYYNNVWLWGGAGPRPMHGPGWRPDSRRPVPARPDRGYDHRGGGNWQRGGGIDRERERRMDRDRRDFDRW